MPATSASRPGASGCDLPQLGDRGGGLGLAQVPPACVPRGGAAQLGHDQAVTVRSAVIMGHLARIEHGDAKNNLNSGNEPDPGRMALECRCPGFTVRTWTLS
jgi:hypothetical protein